MKKFKFEIQAYNEIIVEAETALEARQELVIQNPDGLFKNQDVVISDGTELK